ncbi:MAG: hypothetical protein KDG89_14085, partial [Geminicoccaceae bacterium]|nr:hypothetical protein [Geminicoccaceae bacterium]
STERKKRRRRERMDGLPEGFRSSLGLFAFAPLPGFGGALAACFRAGSKRSKFSSQPSSLAASMKRRDCSGPLVAFGGREPNPSFGNIASLPSRPVANGRGVKKAPRLRFDNPNDALDLARKSVEECRRRLASRGPTVAQRSQKGQIDIAVAMKRPSGGQPDGFKLLLQAVPVAEPEPATALRHKWLRRAGVEPNFGDIEVRLEDNPAFVRPASWGLTSA